MGDLQYKNAGEITYFSFQIYKTIENLRKILDQK